MVNKLLNVILWFALILPTVAQAKNDFIHWHTSSVQLLRGHDYELGSNKRTTMTVEHANSWAYGDFYIFGDQIWPDEGKSFYYVEPTVRLSLGKLFGQSFSYGIIKDVLIAGQVEKPEYQDIRTLVGMGVNIDVPGFKFFKTNLFLRDNPNLAGNTYQATIIWNYPFKTNRTAWLFEGFSDLVGSEGDAVSYQLVVPRLLLDIGSVSSLTNNTLWVGLKWQYWHNKFGIDGITESVPLLQIKAVF